MTFKLYDNVDKSKVKKIGDVTEVYLNKFSDLFSKDGIKEIIFNSMSTFSHGNIKLLNDMYDAVINNYSYNEIIEMLNKNDITFFSLAIHSINYAKRTLDLIKNIDFCNEIHFICNSDNLLEALSLCEKINVPVVIDGTSISLEKYQKILDGYNLSKISNNNILVHYQEYGNDIDINTLYDTSCQINYITMKIKQYNLSPLERLIMVYDIVKNNFYHKEINENYLISRTLDNVLNSDYIVCVGYIALINAILKNLDINAKPIFCQAKDGKHCRGIVYLNDEKYNINGVYILDPTWDSKRSSTSDKLDRYNYFLLPIEIAEKTAKTELIHIINMSINELALFECDFANTEYITEEKTLERINIYYYLKMIFSLTNSNYEDFAENIVFYDFLNSEERKKLDYVYQSVINKCKTKDIDVDTFIKTLYNTKRIEYYLNEDKLPEKYSTRLKLPNTENINISSIKKSAFARYCKIEKLKCISDNFDDLICYIFYKEYLNRYISSNINKMMNLDTDDDIKRDELNMKLLKILKKEKVKKEIDNR